jgi:DNA-binding MarR family transcriptional regulator
MTLHRLRARPGHLIRRAHQFSTALFAEEVGEADLTSVQYAALVAIDENPGIDATRISELIFFDRATIGGVLERLEAKGLIARGARAGDKRVKTVMLTEAGRALIARIEPAVERVQQRLLAALDEADRATLMRLLERVVAADPNPRG